MASKVYWADLRADYRENLPQKLTRLMKTAGMGQIDFEDKFAAIKLHFGEAGNDTYLHPTFVRQVVDCVKATGARPFLTDTCTLYKSTRHNAVDHLETAYRHGFTPYVVDAPVIMADGVTSKCYEEVAVNLKHFASVKIAVWPGPWNRSAPAGR